MIKVYHLDWDKAREQDLKAFYDCIMDAKPFPDFDCYYPVACVDTDDLEVAYRQTNHITHDWTTNPDVSCYRVRNRSTSVGDLAVNRDKTYVVASFGFDEVDHVVLK